MQVNVQQWICWQRNTLRKPKSKNMSYNLEEWSWNLQKEYVAEAEERKAKLEVEMQERRAILSVLKDRL